MSPLWTDCSISNLSCESCIYCWFIFFCFVLFEDLHVAKKTSNKRNSTSTKTDWIQLKSFKGGSRSNYNDKPTNKMQIILDRSLMIGWRKNSWNPKRVPTVVTFVSVCLQVCLSVYLCVCLSIRGPQSTAFDLGVSFFGLSDPWDIRKKSIICFYRHFSIFFNI